MTTVLGLALLSELICPSTLLFCQTLRGSDEASLKAAVEKRLQSMLDTLLGPERTIVEVDVELAYRQSDREFKQVQALRRLPGVITIQPQEPAEARSETDKPIPVVSKLYITILPDSSLPEHLLETIKAMVSEWVGLIPSRGDTIVIKQVPWPQIVSPSPAIQQNYLLYGLMIMVLLAALVTGLYLRSRGRP